MRSSSAQFDPGVRHDAAVFPENREFNREIARKSVDFARWGAKIIHVFKVVRINSRRDKTGKFPGEAGARARRTGNDLAFIRLVEDPSPALISRLPAP